MCRSHKNDEYKLKVVFRKGSQYNVYNFNVKGSRTVGQVSWLVDIHYERYSCQFVHSVSQVG